MKRKLTCIILFFTLILTTTLLFTACGGGDSGVTTRDDLILYYVAEESSSRELFEKSSFYNAESGELELTLDVQTKRYDFSEHFKSLDTKTKWALYLDEMGQNPVPTKIVNNFANGNNYFYIAVSSLDDTLIKNYKIRIYKQYEVTISFAQKNGDRLVVGNEPFQGFLKQVGATWTDDGYYTLPGDVTLEQVPLYEEKGYTFNGWRFGDVDAKGTVLTENVTFTADLTPNKYSFTLDAAGGTLPDGQPSVCQLEYDSQYVLPVPEKEGYTFETWALTRNGQALTDGNGASLDKLGVSDDSELVARWKINSYGVTFVTGSESKGTVTVTSGEDNFTFEPYEKNDSYSNPHMTAEYGSQLKIAVTPSETYTFINLICDGKPVDADNFTVPAKDVVIEVIYDRFVVAISDVESAKGTITGQGAYTAGAEVRLSASPSVGYEFTAWKLDGETVCETSDYTFVMGKENVTLTVVWSAVRVDATLKAENGREDIVVTLVYDDPIELTVPEKRGYDFCGWQTAAGDSVTGADGRGFEVSKFVSAITLTAKWAPKSVTITFDVNGGNGGVETLPKTVKFDETVELPQPTRTGYDFAGWLPEGEGEIFDGKVDFDVDFKLIAQWQAKTVALHLYKTADASDYETVSVTFDAEKALGVPERTGYIFNGWYGKSDGTALTGADGILNKSAFVADAEAVGEWTAIKIKVTFEGAPVEASELTYDAPYTLTAPVKTGYDFGGWQTGGKTVTNENGKSLENSKFLSDVVFTALWIPVEKHVTLDADGGTVDGGSNGFDVKYDAKFTLPVAVKTGYNFGGWSATNGKTYNSATEYVSDFTENVTLTAVWTAKVIEVTFDAGSGAQISSTTQNVTYGQSATLPIPTRSGFRFDGWLNGNVAVCGSDGIISSVTFTTNVTLTAKWTTTSVKVTLDPVNGTLPSGVTTISIIYGQQFTIEVPAREGYVFVGWVLGDTLITDKDGNGLEVSSIDRASTLCARWKAADVTVTLNPAGGTLTKTTVETFFGAENVALGVPTLYGYTFDGWKNASGVSVTESDGKLTSVDFKTNATFTASYSKAYFTVAVSCNTQQGKVTGNGPKLYQSNATITATPNSGFRFTGWYDVNGSLVSQSNPYVFTVEKDVTYSARFADGGSAVSNERDLKAMTATGKYILTQNITLSSEWSPLVFDGGFCGTLDGNGYSIKSFKISTPIEVESGVKTFAFGLFREIGTTGVVKNLTLSGINLDFNNEDAKGSDFIAGAIAAYNKGVIENCHVTGKVQLRPYVIGGTDQEHDYFNNYFFGGLCGENAGSIKYSSSNISVTATETCTGGIMRVAGMVAVDKGKIIGCYSAGTIVSTYPKEKITLQLGQIAALSESSEIYDSKAVGSIKVTANPEVEKQENPTNQIYVGGIVARAKETVIKRCYSAIDIEADVTGNAYIGQIAGDIYGGSQTKEGTRVENCYSAGKIKASVKKHSNTSVGNAYVGYLIGRDMKPSYCVVSNSYYNSSTTITVTLEGSAVAAKDHDGCSSVTPSNTLFTTTLAFGIYDDTLSKNPNKVWVVSSATAELFFVK